MSNGSSMVPHQDLILDAIDQLRHRKARPDAERIYNSLFRRHSISCTDAKLALERCVEAGVVLRVAYKGNISYRNAARKYSHLKRDANGQIIRVPGKPRRKFTALLTSAFGELVMQEPDYLEIGVPANDLVRTILAKDSVRYTKKYITIMLEKEVDGGGLIRMTNGNYLVGPTKDDRCHPQQRHLQMDDSPLKIIPQQQQSQQFPQLGNVVTVVNNGSNFVMEAIRSSSGAQDGHNNINGNGENLRVGGRRKRAKKVFDPSDNNLPKKRGRPIGSLNRTTLEKQKVSDSESCPDSRSSQHNFISSVREQGGVCSVCHLTSKKGPDDRMVSCRECSNKAHASCLNGDEDMMLRMYPDNTWQCPHCKTCVVCYETSDAGTLVVCSICADAYHMGCHQPKLTEKEKSSKWICINCQMPEQLAVDHIQIGFNMEVAKATSNHEDTTRSPILSRNDSPTNSVSLPPSPTPPLLSPQTTHNNNDDSDSKSERSIKLEDDDEDEELEENVDPTIPDATDWSSDQVYKYFVQYFPEEAIAFREQEIDGHSLLLMKRMDVLKGLCLKLGPALKIYRHVLKLQYRRDDPKLYWA